MKNGKTTLNDRLFTVKYLPSKNTYPPKDFPNPSIHNIHCPTLAFSPCHRIDCHGTIPLGSGDGHQDEYSDQTPFQGVTPSGISHPERELESVHLCTYHALIYFPKVIPGFCNKSHMFASHLQCGMTRCPEEDTRRRLYIVYIVVARVTKTLVLFWLINTF